jgi:hypothetical protein
LQDRSGSFPSFAGDRHLKFKGPHCHLLARIQASAWHNPSLQTVCAKQSESSTHGVDTGMSPMLWNVEPIVATCGSKALLSKTSA